MLVTVLNNNLKGLTPYKFKDIQVDVQSNTDTANIKVPDANNVIAATIIYSEGAYYLRPIVLANGKYVNILCTVRHPDVHTIKIRVVYI